jgi:hypothetical protein
MAAWNTHGSHAVNVLPKGAAFNTDYSCDDIPSEVLRARPVRPNRGLIIQTGSANLHTSKRIREFMEKNNPRGAPYPPFSPGLAFPVSFCLAALKISYEGVSS